MNTKNAQPGLVHVYTGDGKGKTTAALGLALRAISYRRHVLMVQFIKGPWRSGELNVVDRLKPYLHIRALGRGFVGIQGDRQPREDHRRAARAALKYAQRAVATGRYGLVILDEVNVALHERLLRTADVLALIRSKPAPVEIACTGRNAPAALVRRADYVSEVRMVKHPFQRGILARPGIDY